MKTIIFILVVVLNAPPSYSASPNEHIQITYFSAIGEVMKYGFCENAAVDLVKRASMRQLLEDGINRNCDVSIVGIGRRHKVFYDDISDMPGLKVTTVPMDSTTCYALYGNNACIYSIVIIVLVYDKTISERKKDKDLWLRCRSNNLDYYIHNQKCKEMIMKADKLFGPKSDVVSGWIDKYEDSFIKAIK